MNKDWIDKTDKLPDTTLDFETMLETHYISKQLILKLIDGKEVKGWYGIYNGDKVWHLKDVDRMFKFEVVTHWMCNE